LREIKGISFLSLFEESTMAIRREILAAPLAWGFAITSSFILSAIPIWRVWYVYPTEVLGELGTFWDALYYFPNSMQFNQLSGTFEMQLHNLVLLSIACPAILGCSSLLYLLIRGEKQKLRKAAPQIGDLT
jgi:hypothetical protein